MNNLLIFNILLLTSINMFAMNKPFEQICSNDVTFSLKTRLYRCQAVEHLPFSCTLVTTVEYNKETDTTTASAEKTRIWPRWGHKETFKKIPNPETIQDLKTKIKKAINDKNFEIQ